MNTERPDNDDVSGETGATEPTEDARGAAEASGTADASVSEASDTVDVSVSEASDTSTGASESDGDPRPARRRS
ncbi:hypothetical protein K8369_08845, partial [Streptomyces sp. PSKA30]|nr:hypothetical protein [Streptomyces sp. PSKA30]